MRTRTTVTLSTAAALTAGVLAAGMAALPATAAPTGRTLHLSSTVVANTYVDLGKKGQSVGDRFEDLFTVRSNGKKVGTFAQDCVLIQASSTKPLALCTGAFMLGGSTIHVTDAPGNSPMLHGAVVGGTGRYADASGTFDVKTGQTASITIHLTH